MLLFEKKIEKWKMKKAMYNHSTLLFTENLNIILFSNNYLYLKNIKKIFYTMKKSVSK